MSTYYLTTPIYYANDLPHIGHAYTTIAADALARFQRQQGRDVFFLTGTDEHGVNIERIGANRGLSPSQHVDAVAASFRDLWSKLDIIYDRFVRTTEAAHRDAVLAFWRRLRASGDLYRDVYQGAYCPRCEAYYQPDELVSETCPVHKLPCEQVQEENWFFHLSRYQDALEKLVRDTDFVQPETRRNEVLGVIRQGLKDFSVSRRQVRWGVRVPDDDHEVIYVWVDALANYLTGVGFPNDAASFDRYWPADVHLVGKEILRFHCLYWPALLLSAGLPLPRRVFAHGWLTKDGKKISKTTGNTIDPRALVAEFGSDAVRYYFIRAIPFGQDSDFTLTSFIARYNADLANDFGNLVQRATTLAARHAPTKAPTHIDEVEGPEAALHGQAAALPTRVADALDRFALHEAAAAVGEYVREVNRYVDLTAPWLLAKRGDAERLGVVVQHLVEATRLVSWYYAPIIPRAAAEAQCRLATEPPSVGPPLFPRLSVR